MSIQTNKVQRVCAKCGATVFADSPRGFCSVCLFRTGLGSLDQENDEQQEPSRIQTDFGDYELLEEIGRGGQGVVYRARQKSLNRTVALKVIGLGQWSSTPHLKRFRHEAEAAASLEHPQIVPIYEIGERGGSCYFSMKFVEGGQLDEVIKREPMSPRRAAELLVKIARTVQFAHEHGILHRDIKPGNILLDRQGQPHLTDFGLARLLEQESTITHSSDVLGTPSYMSPEQAAGQAKELTPATDVYALGAVFYHMLTGQPPFAGDTTYETIRMVLDSEPRNPRLWNPKVDRDLSTICLKCLEKEPKQRYPTAEALAQDLARWLGHEPIEARRTNIFIRGKKWVQRNPATAISTISLSALLVVVGMIIWKSDFSRRSVIPEKSIAVLPFENRIHDPGNAYFADGIQDEILTRLSRIADLKVISRTSTEHYKSKPENVPEIAKQLGVAHILEGSVQKSGDSVRVTVQLIKAANDSHVWGETFNRKLSDIFSVESEVAKAIADQLRAKLTGQEEQVIAAKPTDNPEAYEAYLRGLALWNKVQTSPQDREATVLYFSRAVQLDPKFALAWAYLCVAHTFTYAELGRIPQHLSQAKEALDTAMRLAPESGNTQFALGVYRYRGLGEYEGALAAFQKARDQAANRVEAIEFSAYVKRRQGKWNDALRLHDESLEVDPRNPILLSEAALTYRALRRFNEARALVDRAIEIEPDSMVLFVQKAEIYAAEGDLTAAGRLLERVPPDGRNLILFTARLRYWLFLRQYERAIRESQHMIDGTEKLPKTFVASYRAWLGIARTLAGDTVTAKGDLNQARDELALIRAQGDTSSYIARNLILVSGFLGDKAAVDREATALSNEIENDPLRGPSLTQAFAVARAHLGEKDAAIAAVKNLLNLPGEASLTLALLRADPLWDPLRGDPRFEKILASLAPKD